MAATDGGLQIILDYYPQAKDCAWTNKKFKLRSDERTASASIRKKGDRWKVTDFGGTGHEMDAIDICKYEEHIEYNSEAIALLAQRYGVEKPEYDKLENKQRYGQTINTRSLPVSVLSRRMARKTVSIRCTSLTISERMVTSPGASLIRLQARSHSDIQTAWLN